MPVGTIETRCPRCSKTLTPDGFHTCTPTLAWASLESRVAELEEHAAGLERAVEHLIEAVPECKPALMAFVEKELKIALK